MWEYILLLCSLILLLPDLAYVYLLKGIIHLLSDLFHFLSIYFTGYACCNVLYILWIFLFLSLYFPFSVSKTNLSVHEDKNRVPYVKVRKNRMKAEKLHVHVWLRMLDKQINKFDWRLRVESKCWHCPWLANKNVPKLYNDLQIGLQTCLM